MEYTPAPDYHGSDRFTYVVGDGSGLTAPAAVEVTVLPVNDAPRATGVIPDQTLEAGDGPTSLDLGLFFADRDGDALGYTAVASEQAVAVSLTGATLLAGGRGRGAQPRGRRLELRFVDRPADDQPDVGAALSAVVGRRHGDLGHGRRRHRHGGERAVAVRAAGAERPRAAAGPGGGAPAWKWPADCGWRAACSASKAWASCWRCTRPTTTGSTAPP